MGREIRNITHTIAPADPSRASTVVIGAVLADLVAVIVYVSVGRSSHDDPLSASGLIETGWPFVVGIIGGYIGIVLSRWPLLSLRGGAMIAAMTVIIGVVLRSGVAGDGAPFSFVVVTVLVLSALMLGWRAVIRGVVSRPDRK